MRLSILYESRLALTDGEMAKLEQIADMIGIVGGMPSRNMPVELVNYKGGAVATRLAKHWVEQGSTQVVDRSDIKYGIILTKFMGHSLEVSFIKMHPTAKIVRIITADIRGILREIISSEGGPAPVSPTQPRQEEHAPTNELADFFGFDQVELGYLGKVMSPWRIHSMDDLVGMREKPLILELLKIIGLPRANNVVPQIIAKIKAGFREFDGSDWGK